MTPEQQCCWDILTANPERLCHTFAQELKLIKNKRQFHSRVDEHLSFIMSNFDSSGVLRTVKTWLCEYRLPLDPSKLSMMDQFHNNYSHIVANCPDSIKSYGTGR